MRRALIAVPVFAIAHAAPATTPTYASEPQGEQVPLGYADWVGTYDAKLTWHNCTAAGARTPVLAVEAVDGVLSIDLAPASPGLRAMSLVGEHGNWAGQQGDVKVRLARPRENQLDLAVELDSGCIAKGVLRRASSGVPACDRLVAWSRIEERCTKRSGARSEAERSIDAAKVGRAKWKAGDAATCTARAARLELALVDAGCAPHPDPLIGVRARNCLDLSQASAKLSRCGNIPAQLKDGVVREAQALASAAQSADRSTLPYVEQQCSDARTNLVALATKFSCPL